MSRPIKRSLIISASALLFVALFVPVDFPVPDEPDLPAWCPTRSELQAADGEHGDWAHVFEDSCLYVVSADDEPLDMTTWTRQLVVRPTDDTWDETLTGLEDGLDRVEVIDDGLVIAYPGADRAAQTGCDLVTPERTFHYQGETGACEQLLDLHAALATE